MSKPLSFRKEVAEARRDQWQGGVSLVQPLRTWILAASVLLAASLILLFLYFGEYTRRSTVSGQLVPEAGLSTVMAPANGVIDRLLFEEGEAVEQGQSLAVVTVPRSLASGENVAEELRSILRRRQESATLESRSQDELMRARIAGLERQIALARDELESLTTEAQTRAEQIRLGREILERYRGLSGEQKYISDLEVQRQEQAVLELIAVQQSLERQRRAVSRTIAQLEQRLEEIPAERATRRAALEQELAAIEGDRVRAETGAELLVKAPATGMVASRMVDAGQAVNEGQPLLTILPEGSSLEVQLLLPSRAIGFIEPGDSVLLRYQAFPHQKFGHHRGTVKQVSRSALGSQDYGASMSVGASGEPVYRVRVELESQSIMAFGELEPLRPGMLVDADILGESRRLYEWVLEPLYSVYGAIRGGPSQ